MDNPLENFLKDLANKIQTAKEYKDIVQDSQTVDVNKNVFEGFITGIAETIKKELKERAVVVPVSASDITPEPKQEEDSFVKFVSTLANTISANKNKPSEPIPTAQKSTEENEEKEKPDTQVKSKPVTEPEEDSFQKFLGNLKDIIKKEPAEKPKPVEKINKKQDKPKPVNQYVDELKKDKSEAEEKPLSKEDSIKKLVRQFVEKEIKNFKDEVGTKIGQMGSSYGGGGNNSYNYYPDGGPMFGNLSFPSSGTGVVFADGQLLSAYPTGGGGGGDPAVNTVVYANSGKWNSTYTTVNTYSATWSTGLQDLAFDDNTALLSITNGNTVSLSALSGGGGGGGDPAVNTVVYNNSANWNSNYTATSYFSAFWNAAVDEIFTFYVTQTSAASAFWTEDGNYYFIQNSKLDNWLLWNNVYTQVFLVSSRWDSSYATLNSNSARYDSTYTTLQNNSAKYESVYTTYNQNSASYATEILAIAYAVAL